MPIIEELRAAAEDALARGFAILACEPKDKLPWAKYADHGWKSASRDPKIALKPWDDGTEANYAIACGPSNLSVVDCDHGLKTIEELYAWMEKNHLPMTLIIQSGRVGDDAGFHLYYLGAVTSYKFDMGGVTGELKGLGGYVVGPGSVHNSGKKYVIINDAPLVPLPDHITHMAKEKGKTNFPKPGSGDLIPVNQRWNHLQSRAGSLRNLGLDEEGIYLALKNFAANNCEDGSNYPDDKIQEIAAWAGSDKCESDNGGLVTVGTPDPEFIDAVQELPLDVLGGDYLGDLAFGLTTGTFLPPVFARATIKTMLGAIIDGKIGFPGEPKLHTRHWTAVVSSRPGIGKSETYNRCLSLLGELLDKHNVKFPPSGFFSSGEHAIKTLAEYDNASHLVYFDEMKELFDKGSNTGSTLFSKLLPLYEDKKAAIGAIGTGKASFGNVSLSMTGGFTQSGFDRAVAGKSAGGDGFLSRMVLEYSKGIDYTGDWQPMDVEVVNGAVKKIAARIIELDTLVTQNEGLPILIEEDDDAKKARMGFFTWLAEQKNRIENEMPGASHASRIDAHFKRDLLLRALFSPEMKITVKHVNRAIAWAKHQLFLREELWPVDQGGVIEKCEKRIVKAIETRGPLTKSGAQKFSNADKCEGGYDAWNRAWTNLIRADKVILLKVKSDRGKDKFGFDNAIWNKEKGKWVHG